MSSIDIRIFELRREITHLSTRCASHWRLLKSNTICGSEDLQRVVGMCNVRISNLENEIHALKLERKAS
jgi:hypothetical protein